jgi:hypothetical protein
LDTDKKLTATLDRLSGEEIKRLTTREIFAHFSSLIGSIPEPITSNGGTREAKAQVGRPSGEPLSGKWAGLL